MARCLEPNLGDDTVCSITKHGNCCPVWEADSSNVAADHHCVANYLVVHGTNGWLPNGNQGRQKSKYAMSAVTESQTAPMLESDVDNALGITINEHDYFSALMRENDDVFQLTFKRDPKRKMFQIGRSTSETIDCVVNGKRTTDSNNDGTVTICDYIALDDGGLTDVPVYNPPITALNTVGRFAGRILVDGKTDEGRVYAGAFDRHGILNIGNANYWHITACEMTDGFTKNGIQLLTPVAKFTSFRDAANDTPIWREVSVLGNLYYMTSNTRDRKTETRKKLTSDFDTNILQDGSMIDLCGATLLWRTKEGIAIGPNVGTFKRMIRELNERAIECPVRFAKIIFQTRRNAGTTEAEKMLPYVCLCCGQLQSLHGWKLPAAREGPNCPFCNHPNSRLVELVMGMESAFWVDCEPPTYAFIPCGHMTSENTAKYWSNVPIPDGESGYIGKCPFCAKHLENDGILKIVFGRQSRYD